MSQNKQNLFSYLNVFRCFLAPKDIYPYEKFKAKYGNPQKRRGFNEGLHEIEHNPMIKFLGPVSI